MQKRWIVWVRFSCMRLSITFRKLKGLQRAPAWMARCPIICDRQRLRFEIASIVQRNGSAIRSWQKMLTALILIRRSRRFQRLRHCAVKARLKTFSMKKLFLLMNGVDAHQRQRKRLQTSFMPTRFPKRCGIS